MPKSQPSVRGPKKTPMPRRHLAPVAEPTAHPVKPINIPADKPAKAAKPKVEKAPATPTACFCGCGAVVLKKGSRFSPGHDSKLYSRLLKLQRAQAALANPDTKKGRAEKEQDVKEALAALKGVDMAAAEQWAAVAHAK